MTVGCFFQENIKDKLRAIPIEVSCVIQSARRGKSLTSLPELVPVLDSNMPTKTEVSVKSCVLCYEVIH